MESDSDINRETAMVSRLAANGMEEIRLIAFSLGSSFTCAIYVCVWLSVNLDFFFDPEKHADELRYPPTRRR